MVHGLRTNHEQKQPAEGMTQDDFLLRILHATNTHAMAQALLQGLQGQGVQAEAVAWLEGEQLFFEPPHAASAPLEQHVRMALAGQALATDRMPVVRLFGAEAPYASAALLIAKNCTQPVPADWLAPAGQRMAELLQTRRLQASVQHLEQAERLQRALFAIADMAASDLDLQSLLQRLHQVVQGLMYAENFFIALYDRQRETVRFIYFVDEKDGQLYGPEQEFSTADLHNSITLALIRHAKGMRGPSREVSGNLGLDRSASVGTPSVDFMGVPMRRGAEVLGLLAVQSYHAGYGYTEADQNVLAFVAEHVLNAVERKMGQEALERRVAERTQELAQANARLREQVHERERAAHLQSTLYRIAALGHGQGGNDGFYRSIHESVGELLDAENFFIALLSPDGSRLDFPYGVDAREVQFPSRPFGYGMTEYVIRMGHTVLKSAAEIDALIAAGTVHAATYHTPAQSWLGAPLLGSGGVMGVVAVQSYRSGRSYNQQDADLLTFVSYQIASTLQRRQQDEALQALNAELEDRVHIRTQELRQQIAVREQVQEQLQHQVMHDTLTGLPNRRFLRERLEQAVREQQGSSLRRFALLYLDVDRFKLFNDSFGHLVGDAVLREVAARLHACVRSPDIVGRLSGDEFSIFLDNCAQPAVACMVAQRIQAKMKDPVLAGGHALHVSVSIGIAMSHPRYTSVDAMLHDADTALYQAKAAGRQRYVLFDESQPTPAMNVLDLEQQMRSALAAGQFEPFFQPIVRLADGVVQGYEALVRWQHPTRGLLGPAEFLPTAEESGLIESIDWHMYDAACRAAVGLLQPAQTLNINISPRHFQSKNFGKRLLALLRTTGLEPTRLCVEVTESTLLHNPDEVAQVLFQFSEAGINTALDDFGTGYSSLSHVHRFPITSLKIDRSFVQALGDAHEHRSAVIVAAVLGMAHSLQIGVVAEGVEDQAQREKLLAMGCERGQGFLFGRPQPAAYWLERLRSAA